MWRILICGLLSAGAVQAGVDTARYTEPTTRYAHAVLGDAIEYGALEITTSEGKRVTLRLPQERVFEDIAPRLADMDGDGDAEVITVESAQTAGARLAIYDEAGLVAATPYIGRTNRWLAPLGAADLDGDGRMDHKIGEDFISGGIRTCGGTPEMITANANWTQIIATTFDGTKTNSRTLGAFTGPQSLAAALSCP